MGPSILLEILLERRGSPLNLPGVVSCRGLGETISPEMVERDYEQFALAVCDWLELKLEVARPRPSMKPTMKPTGTRRGREHERAMQVFEVLRVGDSIKRVLNRMGP